ncbi:hypothetical protein BP6252_08795 [Coleophoma cylindrospora]|uniref:Uncharacterized protein n=1 Tax=Coleophoma cylindrospora TaxID=1849047 RepID=A0A3D8R6V0_9HELO|nr:hypothetical protein BP6252_08795 [Coleophoma cylindrospora]
MASFYAEQGRSTDADKVLEDLCRCYLSKFGFDNRHIAQDIVSTKNAARIDYGIQLARTHVAANDITRRSFLSAIEVARNIIGRNSWDKHRFKSFEVLEALLELSATILKGGFENEAWALFSQIEHKAEDNFGWDEEHTIWGKISIGIIYERCKGWAHAESWFNHAYAASTATNDDQDGISKALQVALEKHHFSYLSNEGRPFKTIFGVSGLTFRPVDCI